MLESFRTAFAEPRCPVLRSLSAPSLGTLPHHGPAPHHAPAPHHDPGRSEMRAVRLSDVAQDAGVSLATASRVLHGSSRVPRRAVAEKVQASAAKLGYVANAQAQALAPSRAGLIGLVLHRR